MEDLSPLRGLCAYLLDLAAIGTGAAELRSAQVLTLLLDVFTSGPFPDSPPEPALPTPVRSALDFVRETWATTGMRILRVEELATAAAVSQAHLSRTFSRELGVGPAAALELLRLGRAAQLLQRSNLSLAEVARLTGFSNPYHFSRRFTSAYATPPGRYRRAGEGQDPLAPLARAGLLPLWQRVSPGQGPADAGLR
jgi:AraC-like DNA-binding protein